MNQTPKLSTRVTNQAQVVYGVVKKQPGHLSAEQIYDQAQKSLPRISLGTVYRNLDQLVDRHILAKVIISGVAHFELFHGDHYHVVCQACGKIDDLAPSVDSGIEEFFSRQTDFALTGHQLLLYGICPKCQK